jgi:hypothetical protein
MDPGFGAATFGNGLQDNAELGDEGLNQKGSRLWRGWE